MNNKYILFPEYKCMFLSGVDSNGERFSFHNVISYLFFNGSKEFIKVEYLTTKINYFKSDLISFEEISKMTLENYDSYYGAGNINTYMNDYKETLQVKLFLRRKHYIKELIK
jgi:hypothetical protein